MFRTGVTPLSTSSSSQSSRSRNVAHLSSEASSRADRSEACCGSTTATLRRRQKLCHACLLVRGLGACLFEFLHGPETEKVMAATTQPAPLWAPLRMPPALAPTDAAAMPQLLQRNLELEAEGVGGDQGKTTCADVCTHAVSAEMAESALLQLGHKNATGGMALVDATAAMAEIAKCSHRAEHTRAHAHPHPHPHKGDFYLSHLNLYSESGSVRYAADGGSIFGPACVGMCVTWSLLPRTLR
mmetsp:Transcript_1205/g.3115  ORF Transcript_1205/g.3115 Transcript_1205/m.3115 type:complete len:242 (+) Transcript_1205:1076-1801(+)